MAQRDPAPKRVAQTQKQNSFFGGAAILAAGILIVKLIGMFYKIPLINIIGGKELVYAAKAVGSKTYDVMYPYLGIAVIYLVMVLLLTWLQGKLERRLRQSDRR